jgi:benzoyl-CoA reductase/2-hydroxyglutaryl-CoA dehydratase subunit BcrC/BadD/HgdB
MLAKYYTRLLEAPQKGDFVAAHTVFFPVEILYAMDIVPMHTEMTTWITAMFLGDQAELLSAGAELGLAPEICSPHRGLAGAFHLKALPRPNVMLWSNLICDNSAKSGELVMELNDCPGFFLDRPFQQSKEEVDYFVGELKELINFLERQSGKKMNWDRLSEMVARMDKQIKLLQEIGELRKAVPSPYPFQGFLKLLSADYMYPGQPEAIEYLEALRQELTDMVKSGKGAVPNERFRLMTLFIPPLYLMGFLDKISQERGAVSVVEPLFSLWLEGGLDPSKPLESIAKKSFLTPESRSMYGPLTEQALDEIVKAAKDYKVDGAIYWAFIGCRHTCATIKLVKDILNEIDVPMLTVDCDLVDPTINSKEDVKEKLERFFELLEER